MGGGAQGDENPLRGPKRPNHFSTWAPRGALPRLVPQIFAAPKVSQGHPTGQTKQQNFSAAQTGGQSLTKAEVWAGLRPKAPPGMHPGLRQLLR